MKEKVGNIVGALAIICGMALPIVVDRFIPVSIDTVQPSEIADDLFSRPAAKTPIINTVDEVTLGYYEYQLELLNQLNQYPLSMSHTYFTTNCITYEIYITDITNIHNYQDQLIDLSDYIYNYWQNTIFKDYTITLILTSPLEDRVYLIYTDNKLDYNLPLETLK